MKSLFNRPTSKFDVIMTFAAALTAVWKAYDTAKDFKAEQAEKEQKK